MELAGRLTAGLCEPERFPEATRVPDSTLQDELLMRAAGPARPAEAAAQPPSEGKGGLKK